MSYRNGSVCSTEKNLRLDVSFTNINKKQNRNIAKANKHEGSAIEYFSIILGRQRTQLKALDFPAGCFGQLSNKFNFTGILVFT